MWCVADLDEDYIAQMEDVLEVYEQAYNPNEPVEIGRASCRERV